MRILTPDVPILEKIVRPAVVYTFSCSRFASRGNVNSDR